jgi:hypothetical protein
MDTTRWIFEHASAPRERASEIAAVKRCLVV